MFCSHLDADRRRQEEKQLLSVGTKKQDPKADSLCLLDNTRAFVGGVKCSLFFSVFDFIFLWSLSTTQRESLDMQEIQGSFKD